MRSHLISAIVFLLVAPCLAISLWSSHASVLHKSSPYTRSQKTSSRSRANSATSASDRNVFRGLDLSLLTRFNVVSRGGLTLERCDSDDDCTAPRKCISENQTSCNATSKLCICTPLPPQACERSSECVMGEICAKSSTASPICVSETIANLSDDIIEVPGGLTWDPCRTTSDCEDPRKCEFWIDDEVTECDNEQDDQCHCFPETVTRCTSDADCVDPGELCAQKTDFEEKPFLCVSEEAERNKTFLTAGTPPPSTPTENPSPSAPPEAPSASSSPESSPPAVPPSAPPINTAEPSPCVDVKALKHMDPAELAYDNHAWATVLCDSNESCATSGHIVIFKRRAMMMKTYCDIVGCVEREMFVNSPKYRRGLVVSTDTDGLQFTAFAARYETRIEEAVISSAVRLGF